MSELVEPTLIEEIVGASRHPVKHLGRLISAAADTVYILHSQACKDSGIDLRECVFSKALDNGEFPDTDVWDGLEDRTVQLEILSGYLVPFPYPL